MFLLYLAINIVIDGAITPDEIMRFDIPKFIFDNGYLPNGDEECLRTVFGFSYGFVPYLLSLISVVFMKIASLFSSEYDVIFKSIRMTSVLAGTGTWILVSKIGDELFENKIYGVILTILVCLLPQFVFLCTYLNNDAFAVFCSAIIMYCWIKGIKTNWIIKYCILMAIGIGMLSITYYNSYGFILCSIIVFFIDNIRKKNDIKVIFKKALLIFLIAFSIGGWLFIRNYIIHDGDFLGMDTQYEIGELYAIDLYKPSLRLTAENLGLSFYDCFFSNYYTKLNWVLTTVVSYIGVFGGMLFPMKAISYVPFCLIALAGFIGLIVFLFVKKEKFDRLLAVNYVLCIIIPILLSMYYSYYIDWQPQGRYIMSMIIPFELLITIGLKTLFEMINKQKNKNMTIYIFLAIYVIIVLVLLKIFLIDTCFNYGL